jgi:pimeloyl-ACP methyl ester carboxylesterase
MAEFEHDHFRLFYADDGQGRAIVFIPGLGASHAMFAPQWAVLGGRYRLIGPDLRGNGGSGHLAGPVGTILDRQTDDLAKLLDNLAIDRAVMVGVSYGGVVALHFALRHGSRAAGLVIADTFVDIDWRHPVELGFLAGSYLGLWACYLPRPVMKAVAQRFYRRWPVAAAMIPSLVDGFRPTEAVLQSLAMNRVNYSPRLGDVRCPTLGIVGDATKTGVRFMDRAVRAIPSGRLEIIANSFDPSNLCQPEAFNALLAGYLEELGW